MTPGLSKDIDVMYDHTFLNLQITRSDIRLHIKWAVSLVIAYGHFNLPQGFVWVCMVLHTCTHFITPEGGPKEDPECIASYLVSLTLSVCLLLINYIYLPINSQSVYFHACLWEWTGKVSQRKAHCVLQVVNSLTSACLFPINYLNFCYLNLCYSLTKDS